MSATHAPAPRTVRSCACALALGALAACGGTTGTAGSTDAASGTSAPAAGATTSAAAAAVITIKNFGFTTPASVSPGARVQVRNMDPLAHTVTADSGHVFDDAASPGNTTFSAPTTPGSYPFHCTIHPEMHGVLVVA
jgi:plastocyanin